MTGLITSEYDARDPARHRYRAAREAPKLKTAAVYRERAVAENKHDPLARVDLEPGAAAYLELPVPGRLDEGDASDRSDRNVERPQQSFSERRLWDLFASAVFNHIQYPQSDIIM